MSDKKPERRGLGRGLSALMADTNISVASPEAARRPEAFLPIETITPNPDQPRRTFNEEALAELASSIREKGIIQPLIVRPHPHRPGEYEIVAGERRWRAAQIAQLHKVPAIIRDLDDTEVLEVAIIENIQRADLNPLEEAQSYQALMDKFGHTQEKLAEALSKSRSHIANQLRLLQLPEPVQEFLRDGHLSAGHARAMITARDPVKIARDTVMKNLSVRDVERIVQKEKSNDGAPRAASTPRARNLQKDADTIALENDLSAATGMPVSISLTGGQSGVFSITFTTLEQLDALCARFGGGVND